MTYDDDDRCEECGWPQVGMGLDERCEECRQRHADEAAEHAYDLWREREAS